MPSRRHLLARSRTADGVVETYTYDGGSFGKGRLSSIANDLSGTTSFSYDDAGQLIKQVADIVNVDFTTRWTYDTAGRLTGMTYPDGLVLRYDYDASGRVSGIDRQSGSSWIKLLGSVLYQPATDRRYGWRNANGVPQMVSLDTDGRVTLINTSPPTPSKASPTTSTTT